MCGDDPPALADADRARPSVPRMRGDDPGMESYAKSAEVVLPAHAGMIP